MNMIKRSVSFAGCLRALGWAAIWLVMASAGMARADYRDSVSVLRIGLVETHVAAADLVISSTGNTTCAQVLAAGRPWIVVPEWRYFDEQRLKAEALARAGVALHLPHLPSSAQAWRRAVVQVMANHDPAAQAHLAATETGAAPAARTAAWLEGLAQTLWSRRPNLIPTGAPT